MDIVIFLSFSGCLVLFFFLGRGRFFRQETTHRGLVVDGVQRSIGSGSAFVWFYADEATARRFGRYGRLRLLDTSEAGDDYWELIFSCHVDADEIVNQMRLYGSYSDTSKVV